MRQEAKSICKAQKAGKVTCLFLLSTMGLSFLLDLFVPNVLVAVMTMDEALIWEAVNWGGGVGLFLSLLTLLFGSLMSFGFQRWALKVAGGESPPVGALIEGFGMSGRVLTMEAFRLMFLYFWMLYFCTMIAITTVLLMMIAKSSSLFLQVLEVSMVLTGGVFLLIGTCWLQIRYCLASFELAEEPKKSGFSALARAVKRQKTCFWDLVKFHLGFAPWFFLYLGTIILYYVMTVCFNYVELSPEDLQLEQILELGTTENSTAYLLSQLCDFVFLLKFLPLYFVSLGLFYRNISQKPLEASN